MNLILNHYFYFNFLFSISSSYYHKKMPCERIDCAQSLTVLALKNDSPGVNQFLSNVDKSKQFDPYVVITSDGLHTWVIEGCLLPKDYARVKAYFLTDSSQPRLSGGRHRPYNRNQWIRVSHLPVLNNHSRISMAQSHHHSINHQRELGGSF